MVVAGGVVELVGELDLAAAPEAAAVLVPADGDLVVDCSALTFLDAAGLRVLVKAQKSCEAAGVDFVVVDPAACVTKVLGLTGLDQRFSIRWTKVRH